MGPVRLPPDLCGNYEIVVMSLSITLTPALPPRLVTASDASERGSKLAAPRPQRQVGIYFSSRVHMKYPHEPFRAETR